MLKPFTKCLAALACVAAAGLAPQAARADGLTFNFMYNTATCASTWGTMTVGVVDTNTLSVGFAMTNPGCLPAGSDAQATGFGFNFGVTQTGLSISNPLNSAFTGDQDALNWLALTNLNAIPNPANSSEITKADFWFGATEGSANNITPPGIRIGQFDLFYIDGFTTNLLTVDLASFVDLVGTRYQSLPGNINGGSLFLVGSPSTQNVPEPGTLGLLGAGLFALGFMRRLRKG